MVAKIGHVLHRLHLARQARSYPVLSHLARSRVDLHAPAPDGWSTFNPSLLAHEDGFLATIRTSNYVLDARDRQHRRPTSPPYTVTYLARLTPDLQVATLQSIDDSAVRCDPRAEGGWEDVRLVAHRDAVIVVGTGVSRDSTRGTVAAARLDPSTGRLSDPVFLPSAIGATIEKNWMAFEHDDALLAVHAFRPFRLVHLRPNDGVDTGVPLTPQPTMPRSARRARGGSTFLRVADGYLGVVHEKIVNRLTGALTFPHRFVWMSARFTHARVSQPFFLEAATVEFVSGLARSGDDVLVAWGFRDASARVWRFPVAALEEALDFRWS